MRPENEALMKKVEGYLWEKSYQTAEQLADLCQVTVGRIYRIIRLMRLNSIGVLSAKTGYVMAEVATQADDVFVIKKCYGHRASDVLTIEAARPHMEKRWKSVEDKRAMKSILGPISVNLSKSVGLKVLLKCKNSKGI